jgi:hypothetical protein
MVENFVRDLPKNGTEALVNGENPYPAMRLRFGKWRGPVAK